LGWQNRAEWAKQAGKEKESPKMLIRAAKALDAADLVRFINLAADDLPLHVWRQSVGPEGDPWAYGMTRAARETGSFSYRNAWLAEVEGAVAACLLGYAADPAPSAIDPDTPAIFVPLLQLEALAAGSWYLNVLATYEGFRGKGLGGALLAKAEAIARLGGHRAISLIAANTHQDALRLYRAHGYQEVARRAVVKADWQVEAEDWVLLIKQI
jgi:ribosomal protein S18 acetylase RimI-like enzyme